MVYLTATYFHILWKFYLVTFGNFSGSTLDERLLILTAICCNFNTELYYGPTYVLILGLYHMPTNFALIIAATHFRPGTEREPPAARQC